ASISLGRGVSNIDAKFGESQNTRARSAAERRYLRASQDRSNAPEACNEVEARGGCVRLWNAAVVVVNGELDGCPYEGLI
ncbi:MAG: hypothetical protein ACP5M0_06660, partial [Desulfomonilaceae bacterium]